MHHCGVGGRLLRQSCAGGVRFQEFLTHTGLRETCNRVPKFLTVSFDQFRLRAKRSVHGKLPVVHEQGLCPIAVFQPCDSLFRHAVFNVVSGLAFPEICIAPRGKVAIFGTRSVPMWDIGFKAAFQWRIRLTPQVPLTKVCSRVTRVLEYLTQHRYV